MTQILTKTVPIATRRLFAAVGTNDALVARRIVSRGYASLSQPMKRAIASQSLHALNARDMASFESNEGKDPQGGKNDDTVYEAHKFGYRVATTESLTHFEEDYDANSIHCSGPVTSYIVEEAVPGVLSSEEIDEVLAAHLEWEDMLSTSPRDASHVHDDRYPSEFVEHMDSSAWKQTA
jgi:hypothetical protein